MLPERDLKVLSRAFARLAADLEIPNLRFHDLRHDAASVLTMAGVPHRSIMEILGHRDPRMTIGSSTWCCATATTAASRYHHGHVAEYGIASAKVACLYSRLASAAASGASRLAHDLSRQIDETEALQGGFGATMPGTELSDAISAGAGQRYGTI